MRLNPAWEYVDDRVMGGVSRGALSIGSKDTEPVARLTGAVCLDNNGGFIQMAFDLAPEGGVMDASGWTGLELTLRGNGETYDIRLRTAQLTRPWQSFRTSVTASPAWRVLRLPFDDFQPHRTEAPFDPSALRRIGVLAIGAEFDADISVTGVGFYH